MWEEVNYMVARGDRYCGESGHTLRREVTYSVGRDDIHCRER